MLSHEFDAAAATGTRRDAYCIGSDADGERGGRSDPPSYQGPSGLGPQRSPAPPVGLRLSSLRLEVPEAMALRDHTQLPRALRRVAETIRRHIAHIVTYY